MRKPQTGRCPPSGRPTISRGEEPPSGHGPHHQSGPDGLPIFSFEDAPPARRATPPPRPQRKIPPLIQYRYRAPKAKSGGGAAARALRQRREHTVTWPGPGLTGVSAGHGTRLRSPQIAGWIPLTRRRSRVPPARAAAAATPRRDAGRASEIERENAELVRFIGRSRPSPAMERPQIPRAGGGRGVLPDRLDREARPVVSPSRPARPRRRRRPVAEAPLPADYARYREEVLGDDSDGDGPDLGPRSRALGARRRRPAPAAPPRRHAVAATRDRIHAVAAARGERGLGVRTWTAVDADGRAPRRRLLAARRGAAAAELVRLAPAVPQKRGGMVPRKSVRASPGKDPRAITAEAERRARARGDARKNAERFISCDASRNATARSSGETA